MELSIVPPKTPPRSVFQLLTPPPTGRLSTEFRFSGGYEIVSPIKAHQDIEQKFSFMELPTNVRHQIYRILLVIPALIHVRQKYKSSYFQDEDNNSYLFAERRGLLPGIDSALARLAVAGRSFRFSKYRSKNISILRVSKDVNAEAKAVMYSQNSFIINAPIKDFGLAVDYSITLFPGGYQKLIRKLNICLRSLYGLDWLMQGGHEEIKEFYPAIDRLTLILEFETAGKGLAKLWSKRDDEGQDIYIKRLYDAMAFDFFGGMVGVKSIPPWIHLRSLFDGDRYDDDLEYESGAGYHHHLAASNAVESEHTMEAVARVELKEGLVGAFKLFREQGQGH